MTKCPKCGTEINPLDWTVRPVFNIFYECPNCYCEIDYETVIRGVKTVKIVECGET